MSASLSLVAGMNNGFGLDAADDTLDDAPLTRSNYRLGCSSWRRKPSTPKFRVRGTADLVCLQLGVVFHGCSIWVAHEGEVGFRFPTRVALKGDAPACAFRDLRSRSRFASRAWEAIQHGFPDAATCQVGITHHREQT